MQKRVSLDDEGLWMMPGQVSLQRASYRNLDRLYYRVIPYMDDYKWGEKTKAKLLAAKEVVGGRWSVASGKDYQWADSYVTLPALKTGDYLLLVSPSEDFKTDGFMAYEVCCTDMLLVQNCQVACCSTVARVAPSQGSRCVWSVRSTMRSPK